MDRNRGGQAAHPGAVAAAGLLVALLAAPGAVLALEGWVHLSALAGVPTARYLGTSLGSASLALAIIVGGGTPLAWWLTHLSARAQAWAEALFIIPLLLPPLVLGLALIFLLGPNSATHLAWTNAFAGLVAAEVYEAAPYFVLAAWTAMRAVPAPMAEAAATLGWSSWQLLARLYLPLSAPGIALGAAMAWSRAIGAFGAPIVVSYHPAGLPVGIWITLEDFGLPAAMALALVLVVAALPLPLLVTGWARHAEH